MLQAGGRQHGTSSDGGTGKSDRCAGGTGESDRCHGGTGESDRCNGGGDTVAQAPILLHPHPVFLCRDVLCVQQQVRELHVA